MGTPAETTQKAAYFDRHSTVLTIFLAAILLLYTIGMVLAWYGSIFSSETLQSYAFGLVGLPTEIAILTSLNPDWCGIVFRRIRYKTSSTWLLLNETFRFFMTTDLMLASIFALTPVLLFFSPAVRPGVFTVDRIALVWVEMGVLALFALINGRSVMQVIGMRYETFRGGSLTGAAAYGSLSLLNFKKERPIGLGYLSASLAHVKLAFAARGAELTSIDDSRFAIRSFQDGGAKLSWEPLRFLAEKLTVLPEIKGLPNDLKEFLRSVGWPQEINPIRPRTYGIEWVAATATITGAFVGLLASLVQASGASPLTQAIASPVTPLVLIAVGFFVVALFLHFLRSTYYSVRLRDIDLLERAEIQSSAGLLGKRTTLSTIMLIPRILGAVFFGVFAAGLGIPLIILVVASVWYRSLIFYPPIIYAFGGLIALLFALACYALVRGLWREFKSRKNPA